MLSWVLNDVILGIQRGIGLLINNYCVILHHNGCPGVMKRYLHSLDGDDSCDNPRVTKGYRRLPNAPPYQRGSRSCIRGRAELSSPS